MAHVNVIIFSPLNKGMALHLEKHNLKLLYPKNALIVIQVKLKLAQYKVLKQDVKVKCYYNNEHDNNDNEDNTYIYYGEFQ